MLASLYQKLVNFRWTPLLITLLVFIVASVALWIDDRFYSGDAGIVSLTIKDIQEGKFYSWYFYGQAYFGILQQLLLALLTLPTGISFKILAFWEQFSYFAGLVLLIYSCDEKKARFWLSLLVPTWVFGVKYYEFIYQPQGFAFVFLLLAGIYFVFSRTLSKKKLSYPVTFFAGFMTTLGLWYLPFISISLTILAITVYFDQTLRKAWNLKHWLAMSAGLAVGSIPFILASLSLDFENFKYTFPVSGSSPVEKYSESIMFYARDFLAYFLDLYGYNTQNYRLSNLLNMFLGDARNLFGLGMLLSVGVLLVSALKDRRQYLLDWLFIFALLILLLLKGGDLEHPAFHNVRYAVGFYSFLLFWDLPRLLNYSNLNKSILCKEELTSKERNYLTIKLGKLLDIF